MVRLGSRFGLACLDLHPYEWCGLAPVSDLRALTCNITDKVALQ